ncbi:MAG: hypothetical protein RIS47_1319, partial [Bacteroidota bacterium]
NLLKYIEALQGAIYVIADNTEELYFEQKAIVAMNGRKTTKLRITPGDDLLGRAIKLRKTIYIKKLPDNYLHIESALGFSSTQSLLVVPLITYNRVMGVLELGSLRPFEDHEITFVERLAKELARALLTVKANLKTLELLEATKAQAVDLQERQHEILYQRSLLEITNSKLSREQELTASSIRYAKQIQKAVMPSYAQIQKSFEETYLLYKPRDVVSGDFYWFHTSKNKNTKAAIRYIAMIDCTGHGVPGAFMSLIGNFLLHQIVAEQGETQPSEILEKMNHQLTKYLKQDKEQETNTDGMDMLICKIEADEKQQFQIEYAGAKRPLIYYNATKDKIEIEKATRRSIGGGLKKKAGVPFENHKFKLSKNSTLYLTTDGFTDQNDPERNKFGTTRLLELLTKIKNQNLEKQGIVIETNIAQHQASSAQRDDITLLAVRL